MKNKTYYLVIRFWLSTDTDVLSNNLYFLISDTLDEDAIIDHLCVMLNDEIEIESIIHTNKKEFELLRDRMLIDKITKNICSN